MLKALVKPEILRLVEERDWRTLREVLPEWPPAEIADLLPDLEEAERVLLFRVLPRGTAAEVLAHLEPTYQNQLVVELTNEESRQLLAQLSPDDRTQLLEELPGEVTRRLLNLLSPEDLREARRLLGYPEDSVGRLMTPDYVAVRPEWTIDQALAHIRAHGRDSETINRIYVTDARWRLLDDITLRAIILARPDQTVEQVMDHNFASVQAFADREDAVRMIQRYDVVALPVVDSDGTLLGIVTVDDILDVAEEEATEDFHRVGSVGPIQTSIKNAKISILYRRRIGWLLALVGMNVLSGAGLVAFQHTIEQTVALVFFLPLLIASAGNAGSQSATLMIRAMATGDVRMRDWFGLVGKELAVATALGLTMALAVSTLGVWRGGTMVALVVALTMIVVVMVGSLVGMSLPFLLNRFSLDPATASAPLVASLSDVSGVIIYLSIATWLL